nr:hypothetical protein [uncultured Desulfobacter sp.]
MAIPTPNDPKWKKVISGDNKPNIQFLGLKLLLGRLNMKYKKSPTDATVSECTSELIDFFKKNDHLPKVVGDIETIFG